MYFSVLLFQAEELARILLDAGSRPDDSNAEGRTLLAYSVTHMDESIQLSRLLINAGASVWPNTGKCLCHSMSSLSVCPSLVMDKHW
jgi:hypothetical protein